MIQGRNPLSVTTIIWDLDNTLYKFNHDQIEMWHRGVCTAMGNKGVALSFDEAMELARKGWDEHRDSNHYFCKEHGICAREAHIGMFEFLNHDFIVPCETTPGLMRAMRHHRHAIVTYATKDWARRILDHTGLAEFFRPEFIIGAEDYDFEDKADSPRGILTMLDKLGSDPAETLFVEDTLPNLKPAHEQGVITAYLHHNRPGNDNPPPYVDIAVTDTPELLQKFVR